MDYLKPMILDFIRDKDPKYFVHCIKYVGDVSTFNDSFASYFIDNGILEEFDVYLSFCSKQDRINVIWVISNFAANSSRDSERIALSNLLYKLILFLNDKTYEIRKESIWTLCNIC
jgi:hypothetical protein